MKNSINSKYAFILTALSLTTYGTTYGINGDPRLVMTADEELMRHYINMERERHEQMKKQRKDNRKNPALPMIEPELMIEAEMLEGFMQELDFDQIINNIDDPQTFEEVCYTLDSFIPSSSDVYDHTDLYYQTLELERLIAEKKQSFL